MSWASRRRFIILTSIGAVVVAFLTIIGTTVFYKTPSCSDGVQNQGEAGIDCGGPCQYLCVEQQRSPTVLFTKVISSGAGRTDVVATIQNINATAAARNVPYTLTLYGANQAFLQDISGTLDLPPASTIPIFIPGIASENEKITKIFLTIAPSAPQWFTMTSNPSVKPVVTNTILSGTETSPRIQAILSNASITKLTNIQVIVFVHDAAGEVIAASATVLSTIPAQGQATATFTWNTAFPSVPAQIEVIPVIPLP